ncbi:MAG: V-type ATP synthase subunit I [Lachnospiraceae bacterium]|nr:V-type ATP synthase subunit I [Lachnospiraceae bacterium]
MSVLPMKHIVVCAKRHDRKAILEYLQRLGTVEIISHDVDETDEVFSRIDVSQSAQLFTKNAAQADKALEILAAAAPEKGSILSAFAGRTPISLSDYETNAKKRDVMMKYVSEILRLDKELTEAKADVPRITTQIEAMTPWSSLDYPLSFTGTKKTAAFIGSFPESISESGIAGALAKYAPDVTALDINIINSEDTFTSVLISCLKSDKNAVDDALRRMNFQRPPVSDMVPREQVEAYEKERAAAIERIDKTRDQIAAYADKRDDIRFISDYFRMRASKYEVLGTLEQSKRIFIVEGYVAERDAASLESDLTGRYDVAVELFDPDPSEDVPVQLKNGPFASPMEGVIESYSMPGAGELDPTTPVACFYYILFGMMLSDFAYGALMSIATFVLIKKVKNMERSMRKTLTMFFYCGLGTMLSGLLFGSYFGDAPTVIAKTFFGQDFVIPKLIDPLNEPMKMLVVCFAIGIIHLFAGLFINLYTALKQKRYVDAVSDSVLWMLLVAGLILFGLTTDMVTGMFSLEKLSPAAGTVGKVMAVIGAIGIILMDGRESKSWVKRTLKGLYGLYGVTSYLSDLLSYSRLLALGLATSVISSVFNQMGSMVAGTPVIGVIFFILIFIVGHVLNLAINALGAYVHANRLQYVEFFSKFYSGGGRKFNPFATNTKYISIQNPQDSE